MDFEDEKFPAVERAIIKKALIERDQNTNETVLKRNQNRILDDISISS